MKTKILFYLLFLCVLCVNAQFNLITNGSFESIPAGHKVLEATDSVLLRASQYYSAYTSNDQPPASIVSITKGNWYKKAAVSSDIKAIISKTNYNTGSTSINIKINSGSATTGLTNWYNASVFQPLISMDGSMIYKLTFKAKKDNIVNNQVSTVTVAFGENNSSTKKIFTVQVPLNNDNNWGTYTATFNLPTLISGTTGVTSADFTANSFIAFGITTTYDGSSKTFPSSVFIDDVALSFSFANNNSFENTPANHKVYEAPDSVLLRASQYYSTSTSNDTPAATGVTITKGNWYKKAAMSSDIKAIISKTNYNSGASSINIKVNSGSATTGLTNWYNASVFQILSAIDGNRSYRIMFKLKKEDIVNNQASAITVGFGSNNANTSTIKLFTSVIQLNNDNNWGSYSATFNLPSLISGTTGVTAADFTANSFIALGITTTYDVNSKTLPSSVFIDDVWIEPVSVPWTPAITTITSSSSALLVAFKPGYDGTSVITNYKYSTDGGTIFTACSPAQTTSPIVISGLTNGTSYNVQIKAVNANGEGNATPSTAATPALFSASVSSDANISTYPVTASTDITVSSGVLTVDGNASVKSITVAPGAKLTLGNGNTLTATNGITLQSDATGTATLLNSGTYTGTITAQQYLGAARNWYVCSPISNATSPSTNITRYYEYVEPGDNADFSVTGSTVYWKGLNNGTTMAIGKGYIAQASAGTTVQFSGTANNGNITTTFDLTRNDAKGKGFNLVGNPYPSYLDWVDVATANTNLDNTYYYRTKNSSDAYTFVTWNGAGSSYVVSNGSLPVNSTVTRYIPPTQAFWVRVKTGTSATKMNFTNAMREHRDDNGNLMKAKRQDARTSVRLQLQNGTDTDELLIYQDEAASNSYDAFDSPKMMNNSSVVPDLYSKVGDERLVINGLKTLTDNTELLLGFSLNAASSLKLKATELNNLPEGTKLYLLDKQENSETELTPELEYVFSTTSASLNNENRFSLLFKAPGVTTGINNTDREQVSVFVNTQNQITIIAKPNSNYVIYNAMGQMIDNGKLNAERETLNAKLATGVYFVKVNNQSTRVVVK